jgi:hypothetical protein
MKTKLVLFSNVIFLFLSVEFPMKMFYLYLICSCRFATRIIFFQETLQFKGTIVLFNSCQTIVKITIHVFPPLTWDVSQIIVDIFFLIVSACVLHQSCKHQLLSNLHTTIIIVVIENLFLLVSNIKKYTCDVLNSSLSFLTDYGKKTL